MFFFVKFLKFPYKDVYTMKSWVVRNFFHWSFQPGPCKEKTVSKMKPREELHGSLMTGRTYSGASDSKDDNFCILRK